MKKEWIAEKVDECWVEGIKARISKVPSDGIAYWFIKFTSTGVTFVQRVINVIGENFFKVKQRGSHQYFF
jgi:hypothetical protein